MKTSTACIVEPLARADRAEWERLARGYHDFYKETVAKESYEATWARLMDRAAVFGLGARLDGRLIGIAHYVFHQHVWRGTVCYLQDLFVDERMRGNGIGRALIERLSEIARQRGAFRLYWTTAENNTAARMLYDRVAHLTEFIRYDRPLS